MATLVTLVDKTSGNYEDVFIYTLNASFNGITEIIQTARIEVTFSNLLNIYLGDIELPFTGYTITPVDDGFLYTFTLQEITDPGVAVRLGFGVDFTTLASVGETFVLDSKLYVNDELIVDNLADAITLSATARYESDRDVILPTIDPTPGSPVFFKVALINYGDLGPSIDSVSFEIPSVEGFTIDTEYEIVGYDATTTEKFIDTSLDGQVGVLTDNTITFEMASYSGQRYEFIYRGILSEDLSIGQKLSTTMDYYVNETLSDTDTITLALGDSVYELTSSIYGPDFALADRYVSYELNFKNSGNEILEDLTFTDELSSSIQYYELQTGSFYVSETEQYLDADITIDYVTTLGYTGTLGPYSSNENIVVPTTAFFEDATDNIYSLKWNIGAFGLGATTLIPPAINGVVMSDVEIGRNLLNHLENSWTEDGTTVTSDNNDEISIEDTSTLAPLFSSNKSTTPQSPNTTMTYTLSANTRYSRLENPILAVLMPSTLTYANNATLSFSDYFGADAPTLPEVYVEENFTDLGETLVKFQFDGDYAYEFNQKSDFSISFDVTINSDATDSVSSYMVLNTIDSSNVIADGYTVYRDTDNIAFNETVDTEYAKTTSISNLILFFLSVASSKQVMGALDEDFVSYPEVGTTIDGGDLYYSLQVTNTGNASLSYVKIMDIFPYIGDTGVILTDETRESEFAVYLKSDIVARILPDNITADLVISYSQSSDPLRFGPEFDLIGTDTGSFSTETPSDYTTIRSIRVETSGVTLQPNQTLEVLVSASVPAGVQIDQTAWNSFASDVRYLDYNGDEQRMLGIEPTKAGITIAEAPADTGSFSGYAFLDSNKDGLYNDEDVLLDDIGVGVYDLFGNLVASTFTTPDASGNSGYYTIGNIPLGEYYIQFYADTTVYAFTTQNTEAVNGSYCDSTGVTASFNLSETPDVYNINVGLVTKGSAQDLDTILKVNKQARSMVRSSLYNQMLLGMKQEDVLELARNEAEKS